MATTRAGRSALGDSDTGSPVHVTRFRARLDDPERERRFALQQLPLQRRSTLAAVVVMALLTLGQIPLTRVAGGAATSAEAWALGIAAAVGLALAAAMSCDRTPSVTLGLISAAAVLVPGMAAVVIAVGAEIGAQTILLVVGGVIVVYSSSRLDLLASVATAMAYSAVTVPAWLLVGGPDRWADVVYTLVATALAHFAGIAETRRVHRELRTSFAQRENLRQLSAIDVLTELANRRAFDERLAAVWRGWVTTGRTPTVLMLDIDHFKKLNDALGHQAGDVALRMVAEAIRGCLLKGSSHQVARYGGEEFVVLLPAVNHRVAHVIAERIGAAVRGAGIEKAVISRCSTIAAYEAPLTVSVGIASARPTMTGPQDLVDAADRALYRAKRDGRDCVRCEDDDVAAVAGRP
jgi:diguanylate cyclase (GGDEF)-like protein